MGQTFDDCRRYVEEAAASEGLRYISSGDEPLLIAGVGTYALEILESLPEVDVILAPIGGGSGAAGICLVAKTLRPATQVIGVQSAAAPAAYRSWKEGRPVPAEMKTFAEGLATGLPFEMPQAILRRQPDDFVLVSDDDLRAAMLLADVRRVGKGQTARGAPDILRELERLKADYIAAYSELHRRLVLGPQADDRRQRLYGDPRLRALNTLAEIDLLSSGGELDAWKQGLTSLTTCRQFHEGTLAESPTCPHCHLRPVLQARAGSAEESLDLFEARLDDLLGRWRQALRANLTSEAARHSLQAMGPDERRPVEAFLNQSEDDLSLPDGPATSATRALRGMEAQTLPVQEWVAALKTGGLPTTVEELTRRFSTFMAQRMRGRDARNTRLTLDQ